MSGRWPVWLLLTCGLAACGGSAPPRDQHYSLVLAGDAATRPESGEAGAYLVIGPLELPDYLDRRGLPLQLDATRIQTAASHFWAEPLDEAIGKVLAGEIAARSGLRVDRDAGRWTGGADCRLRMEFDRFHPTQDARVVSAGRYWLQAGDTVSAHEFAIERPLAADGFAHAVEQLRRTLDTLADDIVAELSAMPACH